MRPLTILAATVLVAALVATTASAARAPKPSERAALAQAVFDYYWPNKLLGRIKVTSIRVAPLRTRAAVGSRLVSAYAVVSTRAWTADGQDVGYEYALAVRYVQPNVGWHIFASGTADVGCENRFYPLGMRRTILKQLGARCSS